MGREPLFRATIVSILFVATIVLTAQSTSIRAAFLPARPTPGLPPAGVSAARRPPHAPPLLDDLSSSAMPPFGRNYETTTALADSYPSPWDVSWLPGDQNQVINAINSIVTDPSAGGSSDSGLAGHGSTILSYSLNSIAGNPAGVNPAFTLAMFRKEANFARPGTIAYNQNNPGNLRCAGYGMIDCQNGFAVFASMDDGIKAYFWMLQYQYKPGGGWPSNFNCADITCIITHYCPPSQCDTQGYIAQVGQWTQDFMARISSGGGTIPLTASWASPSNGQTISSGTVHLEASVSGGSGGGYEVAFSAKYSGNWHSVKPRSSSTSFDWNMCSSGVPEWGH